MFFPQFNGLDDRLVTTIGIKVPNYNLYHLDVQIDTGAMSSCVRFATIPEYYWKKINISFREVNGTMVSILGFSHDFPLLLNEKKVTVNLYSYDTSVDMLLGQYFVNIYLPFNVTSDEI
jgi:hypothetical protein